MNDYVVRQLEDAMRVSKVDMKSINSGIKFSKLYKMDSSQPLQVNPSHQTFVEPSFAPPEESA